METTVKIKPTMLLASILIMALFLSGCSRETSGGTSVSSAAGADLYQQTCSHCHGPDAKGLPNLGKDLTTSAFVKAHDDQALLAFVKHGRMPEDTGNTTGVPMPPRGGNPSLTDAQILDIISYVRTLEG